jgi:hypothetical protein
MKKYIVAILLSVFSAQAQEEVPAYLKDSVITVTLKDGKVYTFSGNEYKVVKRGSKAKPVEAELQKVTVINHVRKRNRLTVHGGIGFDGLNTNLAPNSVTIKQSKEPVFGISLSRDFDYDFSLSATALTNQTYLLGVGKDF